MSHSTYVLIKIRKICEHDLPRRGSLQPLQMALQTATASRKTMTGRIQYSNTYVQTRNYALMSKNNAANGGRPLNNAKEKQERVPVDEIEIPTHIRTTKSSEISTVATGAREPQTALRRLTSVSWDSTAGLIPCSINERLHTHTQDKCVSTKPMDEVGTAVQTRGHKSQRKSK